MINAIDFITWWLLKVPKNIFRTMKRVLALVNNQMSFTINIKLLFTPLFGDYTIIGRFTGLIFRIINIFAGMIFLTILSALTLVSPLIWPIIPILLFVFSKILILFYIPIILLIWYLNNRNKAKHKIINCHENYKNAVKPEALSLLDSEEIQLNKLIQQLFLNKKIVPILIRSELINTDLSGKIPSLSYINKQELINKTFETAKKLESKYVEIEHLFLTILKEIDQMDSILLTYNSNLEIITETIQWIVKAKDLSEELYIWQEDYKMPPAGGTGRGMTNRVTPLLNTISEDFTEQVKLGYIKPVSGRREEIEEIADILSSDKANILLVGEPGSGKTSIIKGIAYEIIIGTKNKTLNNKRIISLNIGKLLTGTKTAGEVATKITSAMGEIQGSRDIILFVDEMHELIKGTSESLSNVYSILEPYISSPNIQFIGATSVQDYRKFIEPIGSFARLFNIIEIKEASEKDTMEILKERAKNFEARYKVLITYPALKAAIKLSEKLVHERVLPDKAILILGEACSKNQGTLINTTTIEKEIAAYTNIPVESVNADEAKKLLGMFEMMQKMVIGQDEALIQVTEALKRARVGIRNESKPIASFLFVGTTGVGKTQTAKALAKNFFGSKTAMIRLDMSEYQQLDSINRLLGSPDGTLKGFLTDQVRSKPFSLILLDEIEKAHQNILLTFLQVLDDGRLTDNTGTTIDFTNSIIIATSNVGTKEIQEVFAQGGDFEYMKSQALTKVREKFAPEFLNRFNDIIVFHPLTKEGIEKIAKLSLEDVKELTKAKGISITFKPELIKEIVKRGYSPEWGARPLAREIENTIENYLANKILKNEIKSGDNIDLGLEVYS